MSKQVFPGEDFVITDPEQQPGVTLEVHAGIRPVMLLDGYLSDTNVRCSFCKQRQWHRKGIFALLPDGSKALCGHCCAVELTDKTTVAKIERNLEKRVEIAAHRKMSAAVLGNAQELLQILDRDFIPVEKEMLQMIEEMERIFPSLQQRKPPKLAVARGGLATIIEAAEHKLTDLRVEEILKKRKLVDEAIHTGIELLEEGIKAFKPEHISRQLRHLALRARYEESKMVGRTITVGRWEMYRGEYEFWETIYELPLMEMPSTATIHGMLVNT
ncbi:MULTISPECIES: hypothetical protein [unclassified Sulfitobacter]|uniref:hypothetical protein n=1 Tax=unclassified Sulfitobacter TaxID=196795 RepID=UPI0004E36D7E|nr:MULTISPECIES: hypothetical protein [unclassified Sulfitobacter]PTA98892.1 hypothetical protein C8254_10500 [Sulfitobacter sp. CB-A]ULO18990.1 hypothetical protein IV89_001981 [Sulfitobacter sp. CB2047]